jgi:hypothetical protein
MCFRLAKGDAWLAKRDNWQGQRVPSTPSRLVQSADVGSTMRQASSTLVGLPHRMPDRSGHLKQRRFEPGTSGQPPGRSSRTPGLLPWMLGFHFSLLIYPCRQVITKEVALLYVLLHVMKPTSPNSLEHLPHCLFPMAD